MERAFAGASPERAFASAMSAFGPFEPRPHLALAVSGGADSMALALLARDWARSRKGTVTALTVDHGLRPESAAEARRVGRWLARRDIGHRILRWEAGAAAAGQGVQARARAARYDLLSGWCRRSGVLHLLLAHQREDQAETFLLRLGRDSGLAGLAAMAGLRETASVRLLRPLLGQPRASLEDWLRRRGQDWVRDPSNDNTIFARVRLRALLPEYAAEGVDAADFAQLAGRIGRLRADLDAALADRLARAALPHPAGFVRLRPEVLCSGSRWEGMRALSRVLAVVGGGTYPPRQARLARLYEEIADEIAGARLRGRTLAGCRIVLAGGAIIVCREAAAVAPPVPAGAGLNRWDGRVVWRLPARALAPGARIGALGAEGLAEIRASAPHALETPAALAIPGVVRPTLPALSGRSGLVAVPHLGYRRPDRGTARLLPGNCRILTADSLAGARYLAAPGGL